MIVLIRCNFLMRGLYFLRVLAVYQRCTGLDKKLFIVRVRIVLAKTRAHIDIYILIYTYK
jgi:hypothetical protein